MMVKVDPKHVVTAVAGGRVARRRVQLRGRIVDAGRHIMGEKGVDGTTMLEIAQRADIAAGTVYNYFRSKEELAVAVLEDVMHNLAKTIEHVTAEFDDPAEIYAFGIWTVIETAVTDISWRQLLNRAEIISDAMHRVIGPFAIRDLRRATEAGRLSVDDPDLVWRLATHAIVGLSLAITQDKIGREVVPAAVASLLCMAGLEPAAAVKLAGRPEILVALIS